MTKINTDDQKILNNKRESEIVRAIIHDIEKFIFAKIKKSKNKKTGQIDFYIYRWNYIDEYEINIVSLRICAYCKYGKCDDIILPLYSIIQQHIQYSKDAKIISRKYGNINALKLFTQMIRNHCTRYFFTMKKINLSILASILIKVIILLLNINTPLIVHIMVLINLDAVFR